MKLLIYVPNVFFRGKLEPILQSIPGVEFDLISSPSDLSGRSFDYLIFDLEAPHGLDFLEKDPLHSICFASHKNKALFDRAHNLGCHHLFPKSQFFEKLRTLLQTHTHPSDPPTTSHS